VITSRRGSSARSSPFSARPRPSSRTILVFRRPPSHVSHVRARTERCIARGDRQSSIRPILVDLHDRYEYSISPIFCVPAEESCSGCRWLRSRSVPDSPLARSAFGSQVPPAPGADSPRTGTKRVDRNVARRRAHTLLPRSKISTRTRSSLTAPAGYRNGRGVVRDG